MLDFVQVVADHIGRAVGLDDDGRYYVGVATRECVINAITHGNRNDGSKRVFVEFCTTCDPGRTVENVLTIRVRDQGQGFDPNTVGDPLAPENLLKASGRGIFLARCFMDDVQLRSAPEGGMEVQLVKRAP
jgi:serine/threonine-protein kinase RsbW